MSFYYLLIFVVLRIDLSTSAAVFALTAKKELYAKFVKMESEIKELGEQKLALESKIKVLESEKRAAESLLEESEKRENQGKADYQGMKQQGFILMAVGFALGFMVTVIAPRCIRKLRSRQWHSAGSNVGKKVHDQRQRQDTEITIDL